MDRDAALGQLPEAYAAALRLRDQGHDPTRIATALGVDPAAIDSLLELADAKLARILGGTPEPGTARRVEPT